VAWFSIVGDVLGQHGQADSERVRLVTYGIIGMFSWMHRWYRPGDGWSSDALGELYADLVLGGVRAAAA
jgi:hypothetical protein